MSNSGYWHIKAKDDFGKRGNAYVHRLVALTYCDNPMAKNVVNHIDEDKLNNSWDNLEWVTQRENIMHNNANRRTARTLSKPIVALEDSYEIYYWSMQHCADVNNINAGSIKSAIRGNHPLWGVRYRYATSDEVRLYGKGDIIL